MEIIEISGYTEFEKEKIAEKFLVPKQIQENGLDWADITFQKSAILRLIRGFTLEAGVRNLEREIANILRKIAREAVKSRAGCRRDRRSRNRLRHAVGGAAKSRRPRASSPNTRTAAGAEGPAATSVPAAPLRPRRPTGHRVRSGRRSVAAEAPLAA